MPARSGRLEKRIRLEIPMEVSSPRDPSASERATTENVCSLGVRVLTQKAKELNERLLVSSVAGDMRTLARVVYCQRLAGGSFGIGLQFLGVAIDWKKGAGPSASSEWLPISRWIAPPQATLSWRMPACSEKHEASCER